MDAQQALSDLTEISSQIESAVVFDDKGKVAAATHGDGEALAEAAGELLAAADAVRSGDSPLMQFEIATSDGSVFVVRAGKTVIAATTAPQPTSGLVFYDLKSALRNAEPKPKPKPPAKRKPAAAKKPPAKKPAAPRARKKPDAA
jgi:predicted regulator of Ras-like GTPase activity (Roadblock/LC7/MglB family)